MIDPRLDWRYVLAATDWSASVSVVLPNVEADHGAGFGEWMKTVISKDHVEVTWYMSASDVATMALRLRTAVERAESFGVLLPRAVVDKHTTYVYAGTVLETGPDGPGGAKVFTDRETLKDMTEIKAWIEARLP